MMSALGRFLAANIGSMWMVWSFDPGPFVIQLLEQSLVWTEYFHLEFSKLSRSVHIQMRSGGTFFSNVSLSVRLHSTHTIVASENVNACSDYNF
jgi:hypothetical protein